MALTDAVPYGLRDIKLTAYTDVAGTVLAVVSVDLPVARTLSFTDTEDFEELRGDDRVTNSHGKGAAVAWDLESGGLPFAAFRIMSGGTIVESGVAPNSKRVYSKKVTDARPYFRIEGQAISDSGGDLHTVIYRCKATGELSGEFTDGAFFLTAASGAGYAVPSGDDVDKLYDFVQNETITAFVEPGV